MPENSKRMLVTIMFTDMVGYTALMQKNEMLARQKRARHREVFKQTHEEFSGQIIQYFGDGTLSIFQNARDATQCAIDLQLQLKEPIEVPLRIGLHLGEVVLEEDQLIGDAVNVASRVESFAATGSVLVSKEVVDQLKNQQQFSFLSMGAFQFKNVKQSKVLFAVQHEGLIVPSPDELSGKGIRSQTIPDNLPQILTSFIGRKEEISTLTGLLQNHRLITLTGPGGTGKTRLSIQVARVVKGAFQDGIYWIPLASVADPEMVSFSIAKQLGLQEDAVLDIEAVIIRFFKSKRALLVLDNYEQIVASADLVQRLLQNCPDLSILVTSRIILQLPGEMEYQVSPLNLPHLNGTNTLERLENVPSIALFAQRAQLTRRNFQLTQENIVTVAEICIRLDGLPLAIELAAARTKIFKPKALLERLGKCLDLLKGGDQLPERHQTLRQTISWSYDMLTAEEQILFRRFAVFVGGANIEAIEKICGQNDLDDCEMVDVVLALVDKSLLQTEETEEDTRFFMLETIREFAVESLEKSAESRVLKLAHIDYFLHFAKEAGPHFNGPEAESWATKLTYDKSNCLAAIDQAIALDEIRLAYRIIQSLRPFWSYKFTPSEAIQLIERVATFPVAQELYADRQKIKQMLAQFYLWLPLAGKAVVILEENLRFWQEYGDKKLLALAMNDLGWAYDWMFKVKENLELSTQAKAIFEELNDTRPLIASLVNISASLCRQGKHKEALPLIQQCLALNSESGDVRRHVYISSFLGFIHFYLGRYDKAEKILNEALETIREKGFIFYENLVLCYIGFLTFEKNDFETCKNIASDIEKRGLKLNSKWSMLAAYQNYTLAAIGKKELEDARYWGARMQEIRDIMQAEPVGIRVDMIMGRIAMLHGDPDYARPYVRKMMENEIEIGSYSGFIPGLEASARIAQMEGKNEIAATLYFNAQRLRASLETPHFKSEEKLYKELEQQLIAALGQEKLGAIKEKKRSDQELLDIALTVVKG